MIRHFITFASFMLSARFLYIVAGHVPTVLGSLCSLIAGILSIGSIVWFLIKLIDWWGEEAPILNPRIPFKWSRITYREARTRLRLIELFNGDSRLARRQVKILMERHPGKTESWCWEKAIVDIERDRT